ncbi:hypothetical protein HELRODRAFT_192775 [Helobdella robusta]|uniref:Uncharacterized protein n=1 Tax=Helobdella robusta TaxID=6412 RepID=T1FU99_HELRO|nr:hypothetical protein HELRODRAFT_192775 [Helobdella robusta]ESN99750.1 hypothetical protein HELRODRAFT_192775 [Helobdella robusta]
MEPTTSNEQISEKLLLNLKRQRTQVQNKLRKTTKTLEEVSELDEIEDAQRQLKVNLEKNKRQASKGDEDGADNAAWVGDGGDDKRDGDSVGKDGLSSSVMSPRTLVRQEASTTVSTKKPAISLSVRNRLLETLKTAKDKAKDDVYKSMKQVSVDESVDGADVGGGGGSSSRVRFDAREHVMMERLIMQKMMQLKHFRKFFTADGKLKDTPYEEQMNFFFKIFDGKDAGEAAAAAAGGSGTGDEAGKVDGKRGDVVAAGGDGGGEKITGEVPEEGKDTEIDDAADERYFWAPYFYGQSLVEERDIDVMGSKVYMYPSVLPVILPPSMIHDWAEEGFYVARKPLVAASSYNKMEYRLIVEKLGGTSEEEAMDAVKKAKLLKWFGDDGRLIGQPDWPRDIYFKLDILPEYDSRFVTNYQKPVIGVERQIGLNDFFRLEIDINSITFTHHHLFGKEHVLASLLRQQCKLKSVRSAYERARKEVSNS